LIVTDLIDCVQKMMVWMHRQKRWIGGFRGQSNARKVSRRRIVAIGINSFARAVFLRVGPDVNEILFVAGRRCRRTTIADKQ